MNHTDVGARRKKTLSPVWYEDIGPFEVNGAEVIELIGTIAL